MRIIPGYKLLTCLFRGASSKIYRALRLSNEQTVIIKLSAEKILTEKKLQRFQREFEMGQRVNSPHVVRYLELKQDVSYGIALVMEDDKAVELNSVIPSQGFSEREFLEIAIQTVEGLQAIHAANIIHEDIKPSNILIQSTTKVIKIIDFSHSSTLRQEMQPAIPMAVGTLVYISPEQTGRINRSVDYRTDFYSLGVTFYQLLTGQLPFTAKDALGLIHLHLAKRPQPPHSLKSTIALSLSQIVMKLLEKEAENRYQSCEGILHDLTYCLSTLNEMGTIPEFKLRLQDFSNKLTLSQHLYGRQREIKTLVEALRRINRGKREVFMVAGQPGIGKSMLIQEIRQPLALLNGFFLSGKFDQLKTNVAYSALRRAFDDFINRLLLEDEVNIIQWKTRLLTALGTQAQLIIEVIPSLALLIGDQPAAPVVDISQVKNVFKIVFVEFVNVFATAMHPLVIFLDDLQWADDATLDLMTHLLQQSNLSYLLWIGAYRDTEVTSKHPAMQAIATLKEAAIYIETLTLTPLELKSLCQWLADSLYMPVQEVTSLAELIQQKTAGNPFFVKMFLQSLYDQHLLIFSQQTHWQWDINKIRQHPATENVVMLMAYQIKQLTPITQEALSVASCLGHRFSLNMLLIAMRVSKESINNVLQPALNSGILIQTNGEIYFIHDRVQEAAYHLNEKEKLQLHFTIGERLKACLETEEAWLFDVVAQYNHCQSMITDTKKRLEIFHLNLEASQKSKQTTAYAAALDYLHISQKWIDVEELWKTDYLLAFNWHRELAEVEYLSGHFEAVEKLIDELQPRLQSIFHKIEIYDLLVRQKILQGQYQKAVVLCCDALQLLGIVLPLDNLARFTQETALEIKQILEKTSVASLLDSVPIIVDPEKKAIFKILSGLHSGAYLAGVETLTAAVMLSVKLSLTLGHVPESCQSYGMYGFLLGDQFHEYSLGYEFDNLAIKLADKLQSPVQRWRSTQMLSTFIFPWFRPLPEVPSALATVFESCWACGDIEYAGYCIIHKTTMLLCQNTPLAKVKQENLQLLQFAQNTKSQLAVDMGQAIQRLLANLTGDTPNEMSFVTNGINEAEFEKYCRDVNSFYTLCIYYFYKACIFYLYGYFEQAQSILNSAKEYLAFIPGHYIKALFNWYDSLICLARYPKVSTADQQDFLQQIKKNQKLMQLWQSNCYENFTHKYFVIEAELSRINKEYKRAESLYDQAINLAWKYGFIQERGLIAELAAQYWLAEDKSICALGYLTTVFSDYKQWGAKYKLAQLKARYGDLLYASASPSLSHLVINQETTITSNILKYLDLSSILKASQVISSEIELSKLLHKIMEIIIENAGAQHGAVLLVEGEENLFVQAEYTNDGTIMTLQKIPLDDWSRGSHAVIQYVKRTQQPVILDNAVRAEQFESDLYIKQAQSKSILCIPLVREGFKGVLYLENNLISHAFSPERVQTMLILTAQMTISLENAHSFAEKIAHARQLADQEARIRLAEESLQAVTHDLQLALQASKAGTWNWRIDTNNVTWDAGNCALFGLKPEEFGGTYESFVACVHPEDREPLAQSVKRCIEQNIPHNMEFRVIWPDGSQHMISTHSRVSRDVQGQPIKMAGVCLDVTQRSRLEQERLHALQQAEAEQRQRAHEAIEHKKKLEEITDTLCHELRNPLHGLYGSATLLREAIKELKSLRDWEKVTTIKDFLVKAEEQLDIADICIKQLREIIDDVLDYSKLEHNRITLVEMPFDLKVMLKSELQMFAQPIKQKNLDIILELSDQPLILKSDETQLKRVVTNLLSNAIKFTAKGSIKIKAQEKMISSTETELFLAVEDMGIGIAEPVEEVFKRFSAISRRTGAEYGGSGMGLAISEQLVKKMGGEIWVESQLGKGSKFSFTIKCKPLTVEEKVEWQAKSKQVQESLILEPVSDTEKIILVVEDNILNQKILISYLKKAGYLCEIASNGLEAIAKFKAAKFNAILMDIEMPEMDGIEATREIRVLEKNLNYITPIIGLSGYADEKHKSRAFQAGMNNYLVKPYDKEAILAILKENINLQVPELPAAAFAERIEPVTEELIVSTDVKERKTTRHERQRARHNSKATNSLIEKAIAETLGRWRTCAFVPEEEKEQAAHVILMVFHDRKIGADEYVLLEQIVGAAIHRQSPRYVCFNKIYSIDIEQIGFMRQLQAIHDQKELPAHVLQA